MFRSKLAQVIFKKVHEKILTFKASANMSFSNTDKMGTRLCQELSAVTAASRI